MFNKEKARKQDETGGAVKHPSIPAQLYHKMEIVSTPDKKTVLLDGNDITTMVTKVRYDVVRDEAKVILETRPDILLFASESEVSFLTPHLRPEGGHRWKTPITKLS